jgi:hypothetical protein
MTMEIEPEKPNEKSRVWNYQNFVEPLYREDYRAVLSHYPLLAYTVKFKSLQMIELFANFYADSEISDDEAFNINTSVATAVKVFLEIIENADMVLIPREEYLKFKKQTP